MNPKTAGISIKTSPVSLCKKGDTKAYKVLYDLYAKAMLNISARIVGNLAGAEDVLQESFLKAFQNIQKFENEAAFGSWLKRVVINSSIDVIRKRKESFISLDKIDLVENEAEEEEMAYDIATVKDCMLQLPDGYRVVLTLYLFENYSHKDIAVALKISEGTSKSQYNRAKKKLIQSIQNKKTIHEQ